MTITGRFALRGLHCWRYGWLIAGVSDQMVSKDLFFLSSLQITGSDGIPILNTGCIASVIYSTCLSGDVHWP